MEYKKIGFGKDVNDYYNHYIGIADAKAGAVLAIAFVLIDYLFGLDTANFSYKWVLYLAVLFFVVSVILSLLTVFPRTPKKKKKGYVFWEEVRNHVSKEEYAKALSQLDEHQIEQEYSFQNYILSSLLHTKHIIVAWSIGLTIAGIVITAIVKILLLNA